MKEVREDTQAVRSERGRELSIAAEASSVRSPHYFLSVVACHRYASAPYAITLMAQGPRGTFLSSDVICSLFV